MQKPQVEKIPDFDFLWRCSNWKKEFELRSSNDREKTWKTALNLNLVTVTSLEYSREKFILYAGKLYTSLKVHSNYIQV